MKVELGPVELRQALGSNRLDALPRIVVLVVLPFPDVHEAPQGEGGAVSLAPPDAPLSHDAACALLVPVALPVCVAAILVGRQGVGLPNLCCILGTRRRPCRRLRGILGQRSATAAAAALLSGLRAGRLLGRRADRGGPAGGRSDLRGVVFARLGSQLGDGPWQRRTCRPRRATPRQPKHRWRRSRRLPLRVPCCWHRRGTVHAALSHPGVGITGRCGRYLR
mmetsp:Transcript_21029/g.65894  ORF Transcript_21029/g.65894 Transcript_21029/m.65894 type:complete len:222 (+) Transcript_21029:220-885(+)